MNFNYYFGQQPERVQQFLLCTSVVDNLTPEVSSKLAGTSPVQATKLLADIKQNTSYLVLLDSEQRRYRYQPLFREFLNQRLLPAQRRKLHAQASRWYAERGSKIKAIHHALAAEQFPTAVRLIHTAYKELLITGHLAPFERWLEVIPETLLAQDTVLLLIKLVLYIYRGDLDSAALLFERVKSLQHDDSTHDELLRLEQFFASIRGDAPAIALSKVDNTDFFSSIVAIGTALQYAHKGNIETASPLYRKVASSPIPFVASSALGNWADFLYRELKLHEACTLYQEALEIGISQQTPGPSTGWLHLQLATIFYEWDELNRVMTHLPPALALCQAWEHAELVTASYQLQAWVDYTKGNYQQALTTLQHLQLTAHNKRSVRRAQAQAARLHLLQGEQAEALSWLEQTEPTSTYQPHRISDYLTQIRVWIATGSYREASKRLKWLTHYAQNRVGVIFRCQLLTALLYYVQGRDVAAWEALEKALPRAASEQLVRSLLNEGPQMTELLSSYAEQYLTIPHPYGDFFLACGVTPPYLHLTDRESQVLRLVADGLTNAEIALKLTISAGTVKKHLDNIYEKLNARNRTEAVTIALTRKLLS